MAPGQPVAKGEPVEGYRRFRPGSILSAPKAGGEADPNRVKKSIFDILGQRVIQARVIDLFAGSGSLGIEALSRGARSCFFVDNRYQCYQIIIRNLVKTK